MDFFLLIFIFLLPLLLVFGIAYLAAQSRKKKQQLLLDEMPPDVDFHAIIRYNVGQQQDKVMKMKAFQGSGILYVKDKILHFVTTNGMNYQMPLTEVQVYWLGENLANGLLKWFAVKHGTQDYYFNVESGLFIFHTDNTKPTTLSIYQRLLALQQEAASVSTSHN